MHTSCIALPLECILFLAIDKHTIAAIFVFIRIWCFEEGEEEMKLHFYHVFCPVESVTCFELYFHKYWQVVKHGTQKIYDTVTLHSRNYMQRRI